MNFEYNQYYEIYNSGSGKYVNLSGDHEDGIVSNGEKVTMYARTNNPDQRWALERYGSDYRVRIVLQRGDGWYALNYNTSTAGCIVWHLNSAADSDTVITLEPVVSFGGLYRLKLPAHNAYLTVVGSELKWLPYTGDGNQYFLFVEPGSNPGGGTLQKTIDIPVLLSQKSHTDQWFRGAGCAVTAGIMAAAYRDNTIYNIHSFDGTAPSKQPYWTESDGYVRWETPRGWCFVEDGNVTKYPSDAETVAYIKSIIDMDIPPICHCPTLDGHWMLAYGYTSGSTFDDIKIVDPADGTRKTLKEGIILSCGSGGLSAGITRIRKASSAH